MGPAKAKKSEPSGRDLMTAQQKKDADIANIGQKAAAKEAKVSRVNMSPDSHDAA